MDNAEQNANQFVFGLDIGTRNVVGTVGYREGKDFYVAAQYMKSMKPELCWMVRFMTSEE